MDLTSFFINSKKYKEQRDEYQQHFKARVAPPKKRVIFKSDAPMSISELHHIGSSIEYDYNKLSREDIEIHLGVSCELDVNYIKIFEASEDAPPFFPEEQLDDAGLNCWVRYIQSTHTINSLNFDVYGVEIDITQFKNRTVSCLIAECSPFVFHCGKNIYRFDVVYSDDCDCFPGILSVHNIYNTVTKEKVDFYCDLYSQNTSKTKFNNFLMLLKTQSLDEYFSERYGWFLKLSEQLSLDFNVLGENYEKSKVNISHNTFIMIEGRYNDKIVLFIDENTQCDDYNLYIVDASHWEEKYSQRDRMKYSLEHPSDTPYEVLKDCINEFSRRNSGQYGYYNEKQCYQNEKVFLDYLKNDNIRDTVIKDHYYKGPEFDVVMLYIPKYERDDALCHEHLKDMCFPLDVYYIRITASISEVKFCISAKLHDLTKFANDYYAQPNTTNYYLSYRRCPAFPKYAYCFEDIGEFELTGSYDTCINTLKYFLENI